MGQRWRREGNRRTREKKSADFGTPPFSLLLSLGPRSPSDNSTMDRKDRCRGGGASAVSIGAREREGQVVAAVQSAHFCLFFPHLSPSAGRLFLPRSPSLAPLAILLSPCHFAFTEGSLPLFSVEAVADDNGREQPPAPPRGCDFDAPCVSVCVCVFFFFKTRYREGVGGYGMR